MPLSEPQSAQAKALYLKWANGELGMSEMSNDQLNLLEQWHNETSQPQGEPGAEAPAIPGKAGKTDLTGVLQAILRGGLGGVSLGLSNRIPAIKNMPAADTTPEKLAEMVAGLLGYGVPYAGGLKLASKIPALARAGTAIIPATKIKGIPIFPGFTQAKGGIPGAIQHALAGAGTQGAESALSGESPEEVLRRIALGGAFAAPFGAMAGRAGRIAPRIPAEAIAPAAAAEAPPLLAPAVGGDVMTRAPHGPISPDRLKDLARSLQLGLTEARGNLPRTEQGALNLGSPEELLSKIMKGPGAPTVAAAPVPTPRPSPARPATPVSSEANANQLLRLKKKDLDALVLQGKASQKDVDAELARRAAKRPERIAPQKREQLESTMLQTLEERPPARPGAHRDAPKGKIDPQRAKVLELVSKWAHSGDEKYLQQAFALDPQYAGTLSKPGSSTPFKAVEGVDRELIRMKRPELEALAALNSPESAAANAEMARRAAKHPQRKPVDQQDLVKALDDRRAAKKVTPMDAGMDAPGAPSRSELYGAPNAELRRLKKKDLDAIKSLSPEKAAEVDAELARRAAGRAEKFGAPAASAQAAPKPAPKKEIPPVPVGTKAAIEPKDWMKPGALVEVYTMVGNKRDWHRATIASINPAANEVTFAIPGGAGGHKPMVLPMPIIWKEGKRAGQANKMFRPADAVEKRAPSPGQAAARERQSKSAKGQIAIREAGLTRKEFRKVQRGAAEPVGGPPVTEMKYPPDKLAEWRLETGGKGDVRAWMEEQGVQPVSAAKVGKPSAEKSTKKFLSLEERRDVAAKLTDAQLNFAFEQGKLPGLLKLFEVEPVGVTGKDQLIAAYKKAIAAWKAGRLKGGPSEIDV